jgi:hypothetical protein
MKELIFWYSQQHKAVPWKKVLKFSEKCLQSERSVNPRNEPNDLR